jgi:predicted TPR repeat methyltransferase
MNNHNQAIKQQAQASLQSNRLAEAKALYDQVTRNDRHDWEAWHMLSAVHGMLGEFPESEKCSRRVIALQSDMLGAYINLGNALMAQEKYDDALPCYRRVLQMKPDDPQAHNNLGNLLKHQGKLAEAEASYRKALEHAPDYPDACNNLGMALQEQGKLDEAFIQYRQAITLQPDHVDALHNFGSALVAHGDLPGAIACYEHLTKLHPSNAKGWVMLGSLYGQQKQFDQGIAACRQAITLQANFTDAHFNLGTIYQAKGDKEQAAAQYREALRIKPNMETARYQLATLGIEAAPDQSPASYVKELFDRYAEKFDKNLIQDLAYRTPELLNSAVRKALAQGRNKLDVLDLGCGTGLGGALFRDIARHMTGVDLSPKMLQKARQRAIYDELLVGDVMLPLETTAAACDLIIATDVFVYIGDLQAIFIACARTLRSEGLFAFSIEALPEGTTYSLRASGRYAHAAEYVQSLADTAGLRAISTESAILRQEAGIGVEGCIFVFQKD